MRFHQLSFSTIKALNFFAPSLLQYALDQLSLVHPGTWRAGTWKSRLFEKGNHFPSTLIFEFNMLIFSGVSGFLREGFLFLLDLFGFLQNFWHVGLGQREGNVVDWFFCACFSFLSETWSQLRPCKCFQSSDLELQIFTSTSESHSLVCLQNFTQLPELMQASSRGHQLEEAILQEPKRHRRREVLPMGMWRETGPGDNSLHAFWRYLRGV